MVSVVFFSAKPISVGFTLIKWLKWKKHTFPPVCLFLRTQCKFSDKRQAVCCVHGTLTSFPMCLPFPCNEGIALLSLKTVSAIYQSLVLWNHRITDSLCPDSELNSSKLNHLPSKKEVVKLVIIHPSIYKQTQVAFLSVYIEKEVVNIHCYLVNCQIHGE